MDYIARLEAHLRITRGRVLPLVTFARYSDDDPMQPADPKLPRCETKKKPASAGFFGVEHLLRRNTLWGLGFGRCSGIDAFAICLQ